MLETVDELLRLTPTVGPGVGGGQPAFGSQPGIRQVVDERGDRAVIAAPQDDAARQCLKRANLAGKEH